MAYITERGKYWRAEVRRKGYKPAYRTFDTQRDAQKWAGRVESEMDSGAFQDRTAAASTLFSTALERYRKEIVCSKLHPYQEHRRIDRWLKNDLSFRTFGNLRGTDFAQYRDERRSAGRAENTIRLELQLVSHMYEIARKEWGMDGLQNPIDNIRKPGGSRARDRRLIGDEFERLVGVLSSHPNKFVAPAFELAIETSLRQGTLFKLQWEWVDVQARVIKIPLAMREVANKGVPPILPLSKRASAVLAALENGFEGRKPNGPVLDTTANAVICAWKRTLKKLGITDLRWHDLRHEAVIPPFLTVRMQKKQTLRVHVLPL